MPRRPPPILCVAAGSALLVACLIKPSRPAGTTGDGGTPPRDVGPGGGDGPSGDDASSGPVGSCATQTVIDGFDGAMTEHCNLGPMFSGGTLTMSGSNVGYEDCVWMPPTIGHAVVVELSNLGAGGVNYEADAKLELTYGMNATSVTSAVDVTYHAGATDYVVSGNGSGLDNAPRGVIWLLLQVIDDSHVEAKWRSGSFVANLANWTDLGEAAYGAGTTLQPPTVTLRLDGNGSGDSSATFTSFEYCP